MKFLLTVCCALLIVALARAGPPFPLDGNIPAENLAPECRIPECPDSTSTVNLPYPLDCLQYVHCEAGVRQVKACEGDLIYNKEIGACDKRETTTCLSCW